MNLNVRGEVVDSVRHSGCPKRRLCYIVVECGDGSPGGFRTAQRMFCLVWWKKLTLDVCQFGLHAQPTCVAVYVLYLEAFQRGSGSAEGFQRGKFVELVRILMLHERKRERSENRHDPKP